MKYLSRYGFALAFAAFALTSETASARNSAGEDWQVVRGAEPGSIVAAAGFDNGISLIARCSRTVFDLILTGLPEATGRDVARELIFIVDDEPDEKHTAWTVGDDRSVAFSRLPALIARQLADGGNLQIIIPATPGGRRTRYVMELSRSDSAIEETLTACGRPLVDPRDNRIEGDGIRLPTGITWRSQPRPEFPTAAFGITSYGYATLSCVTGAQGKAEECQIESEQPPGLDFGRAALRATRAARLGQSDEARAAGRPFEGELIVFTTEFRLR
jgi:hypothetical protein